MYINRGNTFIKHNFFNTGGQCCSIAILFSSGFNWVKINLIRTFIIGIEGLINFLKLIKVSTILTSPVGVEDNPNKE